MANGNEFTLQLTPAYNSEVNASLDDLIRNPYLYYNAGDIGWMLAASALVFLMIPGTTLLYSGLSDKQSAIALVRLPLLTAVIIGFQWYMFGYSIAFSPPGYSPADGQISFWGSSDGVFFRKVFASPVGNENGPKIPELVYALFQGMFAAFTASLVAGVTARKFRPAQFLLFIFLWSTLVYDVIARWTWHWQGWSRRNGSMDFAGGTVVHISSAMAVSACAVFFGLKIKFSSRDPDRRRETRQNHTRLHRASSISNIVLGTALLWFGWMGFNGGSAFGANMRAVSACMCTNVAACFGGLTSILVYWGAQRIKAPRRPGADIELQIVNGNGTLGGNSGDSHRVEPAAAQNGEESEDDSSNLVGAFCNGVIVGLVAITPAAGYVPVKFAPVFGVIASFWLEFWMALVQGLYDLAENSKWASYLDIAFFRYDTLEVSMIHGGGGLVGMFLTAFFRRKDIYDIDNSNSTSRYLSDSGVQLGRQLIDVIASAAYSFAVTLFLLTILSSFSFKKWANRTVNAEPLRHKIRD